MKTEKKPQAKKSTGTTEIDTSKLPDLLGLVDYSYSNIVRVSHSAADVRIAFGDIGPMGELKPKFGVVLTRKVALSMAEALQRLVESMKKPSDNGSD